MKVELSKKRSQSEIENTQGQMGAEGTEGHVCSPWKLEALQNRKTQAAISLFLRVGHLKSPAISQVVGCPLAL